MRAVGWDEVDDAELDDDNIEDTSGGELLKPLVDFFTERCCRVWRRPSAKINPKTEPPAMKPREAEGDDIITEEKNAALVAALSLIKQELYDKRKVNEKENEEAWRLLDRLMPFETTTTHTLNVNEEIGLMFGGFKKAAAKCDSLKVVDVEHLGQGKPRSK